MHSWTFGVAGRLKPISDLRDLLAKVFSLADPASQSEPGLELVSHGDKELREEFNLSLPS